MNYSRISNLQIVLGDSNISDQRSVPRVDSTIVSGRRESQDSGCRIPLSYDFLEVLYECKSLDRNLKYETLIELRTMCEVAVKEGRLSKDEEQRLKVQHRSIEERYHYLPHYMDHSGPYVICLERLYTMVYTTEVEPTEAWRELAVLADNLREQLFTGEYDRIIQLVHQHSVEIENAVYIFGGAPDMCKANSLALNFTSYERLLKEGADVAKSPGWSAMGSRSLFCRKVDAAAECGYLTAEQRRSLLVLLETSANTTSAMGISHMNMFG